MVVILEVGVQREITHRIGKSQSDSKTRDASCDYFKFESQKFDDFSDLGTATLNTYPVVNDQCAAVLATGTPLLHP